MVLQVPPDIKGAFLSWAKSQTDITAICTASNIRGTLPTAQNMPTFYLTCTKTGGRGSHRDLPLDTPRLDVWCYGPSGYESNRLARTVRALLIPVSRAQGGIVGFEAAGCRVLDVQDEASAREGVSVEGWPFTWTPFLFRISEIPVS